MTTFTDNQATRQARADVRACLDLIERAYMNGASTQGLTLLHAEFLLRVAAVFPDDPTFTLQTVTEARELLAMTRASRRDHAIVTHLRLTRLHEMVAALISLAGEG